MKKIVLILCFLWICFIAFNTSQSGTVSNNTSVSITEKLVNKTQDIFPWLPLIIFIYTYHLPADILF